MKKAYVKPNIEIVEFASEVLMQAGSANADGLPGFGGGDGEGGNTGPDANRHRGEWGNLWAED